MKRFLAVMWLVFLAFGCQKAEEAKIETNSAVPTKTISTKTEIERPKTGLPIAVPNLVNKTPEELDQFFGKPEEIKLTEDGGEFRLYRIVNEPKGLAVRFYGGKAKNFNLILTKPVASSKAALRQVFGIEVGNSLPEKDVKEPLTEKYQGVFNGIKFSKVSAKKDEKGKGFIFVLAEISK